MEEVYGLQDGVAVQEASGTCRTFNIRQKK